MASKKNLSAPQPAKKKRSAPGRPTPEDVIATDKKILDTALNEFLRHGYGGASMNRIVEECSISKTTLYSRYPSKKDLFRAIIHAQIKSVAPATIFQPKGSAISLEDGLKSYANHMLKTSLQGELLGVNRLIFSESHRFPELGEAAVERTELGIKRIAGFIEECAIDEGIPCKAPEFVAQGFILMIRGLYTNILLTNRKVHHRELEQWVNQAVHLLMTSRNHW